MFCPLSSIQTVGPYPSVAESLEEVCPCATRNSGAALAFALSRLGDGRALVVVAPRFWLTDKGVPFSLNSLARRAGLLLVETAREPDALWAMEQALRSRAVGGVIGMVEHLTLTQSRRLEMAAREAGATAIILRSGTGGLSAARRRWRIGSALSTPHPLDPRAPGPPRIHAELMRSRSEPPGAWILEQDDETHRLRLADRLAGHGLVEDGRAVAAA